jgi:hypothetical protein
MSAKYQLPICLEELRVDETAFVRWLHRKAMAHVRRDRRRGFRDSFVSRYKEHIIRAVAEANGCDFYTGQQLDWRLISKWNNDDASAKGGEYKRAFWNLPTVDHEDPRNPLSPIRLCSWRVNDAKNDQTIEELLKLADDIRKWLTYQGARKAEAS